MMNNKEKKNKKRSLVLTIFLHTAALLVALYPFLISAEEPAKTPQIAVQFVEFKQPTAGASKSKEATATKKSPTPTPKTEVKPTPTPTPTPPQPKSKPVVTTPEPEKPIPTAPKVEVPKKVEKPAPPAPPTPAPVEVAEAGSEASEATSDKVSDTNQSGGAGKNDSGNGNGSSDLEGEGEGDEFSGDGLFRRKVIYRADVKKLIKKNGKITIDLCVNRAGDVISAEYNSELSTIKDRALWEKAVSVTKKYRFEKDNSAAKEQCGRLTFICKVD